MSTSYAEGCTRRAAALATLVSRVEVALIDGPGLILVRGGNLLAEDREFLATAQAILCKLLGTLSPQDDKGHLMKEVTVVAGSAYDVLSTVSHRGRAEMLPHSDSAEIVSLMCVNPAIIGGETKLVSSMKVHELLQRKAPDALEHLYRNLPIDVSGKAADVDGGGYIRRPVFEMSGGRIRCHYNRRRINEGARKAGEQFEADIGAALDLMDTIVGSPELIHEVTLQCGDNLLINNDFILHGRNAYRDFQEDCAVRLLLRVWLTLDEQRRA